MLLVHSSTSSFGVLFFIGNVETRYTRDTEDIPQIFLFDIFCLVHSSEGIRLGEHHGLLREGIIYFKT